MSHVACLAVVAFGLANPVPQDAKEPDSVQVTPDFENESIGKVLESLKLIFLQHGLEVRAVDRKKVVVSVPKEK